MGQLLWDLGRHEMIKLLLSYHADMSSKLRFVRNMSDIGTTRPCRHEVSALQISKMKQLSDRRLEEKTGFFEAFPHRNVHTVNQSGGQKQCLVKKFNLKYVTGIKEVLWRI